MEIEAVLDRIETAATRRELWQIAWDFVTERGADKLSYHHFAGISWNAPQDRNVTVMARGFPKEWVCRYIEDKLYLVDPIPAHALKSTRPFRWDEIEGLTRLTPAQRDFLDKLSAARLGKGFAFQVFGPSLRNGYVGVGLAAGVQPWTADQLMQVQVAMQAAHQRYCELVPANEMSDPPRISPREREILGWIARGKSNTVIAEILGVSRHTVDTQVRRLFEKLNVADRTSAALRGIGAGLILPPPS